jgi:hypothetical protein
MVLSLVALSPGIQDEALAQSGNSSGYEFVTKWGTQGEGPGQFDGQNDVVPLEESFVKCQIMITIVFKNSQTMVHLSQLLELVVSLKANLIIHTV